ncbi:hypothetical protein [Actinomadura logoneensis]|uniref:hypothetical protein n=1 Tax=Actinomadura logoneensis TaxID=2293572 RepID=UPI0011C10A0A|nr:hypothetical protein [Actinomadura logoneensis]
MIKTVLRTAAVTATVAGTVLLAVPAQAGTHIHNSNKGRATGNTVNFMIVGGYGVTCGTVSVAGQAGTACDGNATHNDANRSLSGGGYGGLRGLR